MSFNTEEIIDKQKIIDEFETVVRSVAAAGIDYEAGGQPFREPLNYAEGGHGGGNWANSHTITGGHPDSSFATGVPAGPSLGSFDKAITASNIASVIRDHAYNLTRIRKATLKITSGNGAIYEKVDGPYIFNLSNAYRSKYSELTSAASTFEIESKERINATNLNNYMVRIKDVYNQVRSENTTLSACHSNCHSNCHGSRNRR